MRLLPPLLVCLAGCGSSLDPVCVQLRWDWWATTAETTFDGSVWRAFNVHGDPLTETMRSYEDDRLTTVWHTWDAGGREILRQSREGEAPSGQRLAHQEWEYDADGYLILSWEEEVVGVRDTVRTFTNDGAGNPLEERIDYEDDGVVDTVVSSTWDDDGRPLSRERVSEGEVTSQQTWAYDRHGDAIEETSVTDSRTVRTTSAYDDDRRLVRRETERDGELARVVIYRWEADLLVAEDHLDGSGALERTIEHTYDADGWRIATVTSGPDGVESERQEYDVDEHGNVVRQTDTRGGVETFRAESEWSCFVPERYPEG